MILSIYSIQVNTRCYKCEVTSYYLNATVSGYEFVAAYYSSEPTTTPAVNTAQISPLLRHTGESWQYQNVNTSENGVVEADAHIYVTYMEGETHHDPTPTDQDIPAPTTIKEVTSNHNGTYNIQLDIIGEQIVHTEEKGANVLLIFDRTSSMTSNMTGAPGAGHRIDAARSAVHTLVNALDPATNPVQIACISFGRFADDNMVDWTTNGTSITDFTDNLTLAASGAEGGLNGGTNWEAALGKAKTVLATADSDPTYVIFLTDGNPTIHQGNCEQDGGINGSPNETSDVYTRARTVALTLDKKYKIYGVLCANQSDGPLLQTLMTTMGSNGYNTEHILANDSTTLTNTFKDIADYIVEQLGTSDVSTNDGITSLSTVNASVNGAAGAFKYYRAYKVFEGENSTYYYYNSEGNPVSVTTDQIKEYHYEAPDGTDLKYLYTQREVWVNAPGASYNPNSGVTWNLGSEGTLSEGIIYSIDFTIWPSQKAYDLLADLNNGIKVYAEGQPNSITEEERNQVYESGGIYYMKTNTNLDTTYSSGGDTYTDEIPYHQGAMNLDAETISLEKLWPQNYLDEYMDGWSTDGLQNDIVLTVIKDGSEYLDVIVSRTDEWKKDNIYISCGLITEDVEDNIHTNVDLKETGHDYTIIEPESFTYYWDLISDIYRPMVINGIPTVLKLTDADLEESLTPRAYEEDGKTYYVLYGKTYEVLGTTETASMQARNYRRSNLNLTKEVIGGSSGDDFFTYEIQVKELSSQKYVWFSIMDEQEPDNVSEHLVISEGLVTGAEREIKNGEPTGYYFFPNDGETTVTVKIKEGWNVRFLNLLHNSTFSFEEIEMDSGYEYVGIDGSVSGEAEGDKGWFTVLEDEPKVTGTVEKPNSKYVIKYTNRKLTAPVGILKVDDKGEPLSGAEFQLLEGNSAVQVDGLSSEGKFTSTTDVKVLNLGNGVYCLTELKAPDGFIILDNQLYFQVTHTRTSESDELTTEVILCDAEGNRKDDYSYASVDSTGDVITVVVENAPGAALPNTGGPGSNLIYLLGIMLTGIAAAGVLLRRRWRTA